MSGIRQMMAMSNLFPWGSWPQEVKKELEKRVSEMFQDEAKVTKWCGLLDKTKVGSSSRKKTKFMALAFALEALCEIADKE